MTAYLSSPELTRSFYFPLEEPHTVAARLEDWIATREVSIAVYSDGNQTVPNRFVINWSAVRYFSIDVERPTDDELEQLGQLPANAFLDEMGKLSLAEA